jgi:hypothetical protein
VVPRDDIVSIVIEIAAHLLDDLDYAPAYPNHAPCPKYGFSTNAEA